MNIATSSIVGDAARSYVAAGLAGLTAVPCRVEPIRRADNLDAFTELLAAYNVQRRKTFAEKRDSAELATYRQRVLAALGQDGDTDDGGGDGQ